MLSEVLGEEETAALLKASKEIADKKVTVDTLKKAAKHIGIVKALQFYGIL
jgi:hypothetical protein